MILEQLKRGDSFKEVSPLARGRYQVRFEREGRFGGAMQMVNFATKQQAIFRVRTTEDGLVQVNGYGQGQLYAERLAEVGMTNPGPRADRHRCRGAGTQRALRARLAHEGLYASG